MKSLILLIRAFTIVFVVTQLAGCGSQPEQKKPLVTADSEIDINHERTDEAEILEEVFKNEGAKSRDFSEIKNSGVLRAVTLYSSTGYFLYRGQPMGFELELLENLAAHYDLELQIVVAKGLLDLLRIMHHGEADLISYGLTVTKIRRKYIDFTDYLYLSNQVLVQRKPKNWRDMKLHEIDETLIIDNVELIGKTVSVRAYTAYMQRLHNLIEEIGDQIYIDTMPKNYGTERLIEMVVDGEIEYTIADNNIASLNASYYPELDVRVPMSFSQRVGWGVSKNSPGLLKALNSWLEQIKRKPNFNVIYDRYFDNKKDFRKRLRDDYFSMESGMISEYDDLIKQYALELDWDWRLLASQVYQESQFEPTAKSWAGAVGLLQLMPATAKELGVSNPTNPIENLSGGSRYLKQMWDNWEDIPDSVQRIKFALASYNCGYYHVRDAARLAEKNKVNNLIWDDHVEMYILKLSNPEYFNDPVVHYGYARGLEPFTYVFEIFERYEHYAKFVSAN